MIMVARASEPRPLEGVRIAVTRAGERGSPLADALRAKGATVHEVPLTRIETLDLAPLHDAVRRLVEFDWVLLTSVNAVEHLARVVAERGAETAMCTRRLAVVGVATAAAAERYGWRTPTVQPENAQAVGLLDAMASRSDIEGARMLYPCAAAARDVLPDGLRALGAVVESVPSYRSAPDPEGQARIRALVKSGEIDLVTVAAPSASRNRKGPPRNGGNPMPNTAPISPSRGDRIMPSSRQRTASFSMGSTVRR